MEAKKCVGIRAATRLLLLAVLLLSFVTVVGVLVYSTPICLGYLALRAVDRDDYSRAREIGLLAARISGSRDTADLAVYMSFQRPLLFALKSRNYDRIQAIAHEWNRFRSGQEAAAFLWLGRYYEETGQTDLAKRAYVEGLRIHNKYPSQQQIGCSVLLVSLARVMHSTQKDKDSLSAFMDMLSQEAGLDE